MNHNFGEKLREYSRKKKADVNVWQSPKYEASKKKAIEVIESGKYGLEDGDFWILMNESDKCMVYTGLITSHNACLKINDALQDKFKPSCVSVDKNGYNNSLVYTYINDEQGIYEVGEVAPGNCKNDYPYAMAYKRLFDRVVLKLSKLAYSGVYSEAEADEFRERPEERKPEKEPEKEPEKVPKGVTPEQFVNLTNEMIRTGVPQQAILDRYGIKSLKEMTAEMYSSAMKGLSKTKDKVA